MMEMDLPKDTLEEGQDGDKLKKKVGVWTVC